MLDSIDLSEIVSFAVTIAMLGMVFRLLKQINF